MAEGSTEIPHDGASTVPQVLGGVAPYLNVSDASAAAEFYKRAFGAVELDRRTLGEDGRLIHCHLHINGGSVMLSDPFPEHGCPFEAPQAFTLLVPVQDADAWWSRATAAGAEVVMPLELQFWGDRYGQVRDPFGVIWAVVSAA
jgi:uncharacterized glyoxalase superfamily protein PhnB